MEQQLKDSISRKDFIIEEYANNHYVVKRL